MPNNKIPVLEIFGPTIQGEGMVIGQKTMFVRTAGCDFRCSWCDSAFTWDGSAVKDIQQLSAHEIYSKLKEIGEDRFNHVTISGGNPALISSLDALIDLLHEQNVKVAVETQGSKWQKWLTKVDELTISPKPPSSGMKTDYDMLSHIINELEAVGKGASNVSLKVVVFDEQDFEYAKHIHLSFPKIPFFLQVGNENLSEEIHDDNLTRILLNKLDWLVNKVIDSPELNDAKVLPQLHTLLWGNKRGV
jgi:7-carboxy-7-deazaguanine synthase